LKELPMPDLDQIKQEELERGTRAGGFPWAEWPDGGERTMSIAPARTADFDQVAPLTPIVIASAAKQSRAR
jgi:hypothetical protein